MKIAAAQINGKVGDFPRNAREILQAYREGQELGADLVVTPELALTGYMPRDLVFQSQFLPQGLQALDYLASEVGTLPLLVGYIDHSPHQPGKPFQNAAALLQNGKVRQRFGKTLLPNYDVFDEERYFEPAETGNLLTLNGVKLGITICEDIWTPDYLPSSLYAKNPVAELAEGGAEVIINLSASPFSLGKPKRRHEMLREVAVNHQLPIVYVNCVGANDELIFDGNSFALTREGHLADFLPAFERKVGILNYQTPATHLPEQAEEESLYRALVLGLRDYAAKTGFETACLGLSGGIDSALTAAIAAEALGPQNVTGLTMPSPYSSRGSVDDSFALAKNLGIRCEEVSIKEAFETAKSTLTPLLGELTGDVTEENLQSRLRGLNLMALSNKTGSLLLTTGNKSELAVGYCTIYGDMCGGLAVISDLPKMKVFAVSKWLNREREIIPWTTINKPPSAELRPDQKDEDTLPPYETLDALLELLIEQRQSPEDVIESGRFDEETVHWVARKIFINEWKRRQAAPGLRVTRKAFGIGRRFPIAHGFKG